MNTITPSYTKNRTDPPPTMSDRISDTIALLQSGSEAEATTAATRLGLLLERTRFRRRGTGTLGDVDVLLGDLADIEMSDADVGDVLDGLRRHLAERGLHSNPTVIWAIGKAHDRDDADLVAGLAHQAIDQLQTSDLLYQAIVVLAAVAPGSHRSLFIRAAQDATGQSAEFAAHQASIHGWS